MGKNSRSSHAEGVALHVIIPHAKACGGSVRQSQIQAE
jgi:hypothetical protein